LATGSQATGAQFTFHALVFTYNPVQRVGQAFQPAAGRWSAPGRARRMCLRCARRMCLRCARRITIRRRRSVVSTRPAWIVIHAAHSQEIGAAVGGQHPARVDCDPHGAQPRNWRGGRWSAPGRAHRMCLPDVSAGCACDVPAGCACDVPAGSQSGGAGRWSAPGPG